MHQLLENGKARVLLKSRERVIIREVPMMHIEVGAQLRIEKGLSGKSCSKNSGIQVPY